MEPEPIGGGSDSDVDPNIKFGTAFSDEEEAEGLSRRQRIRKQGPREIAGGAVTKKYVPDWQQEVCNYSVLFLYTM
jgi:hypothetical protein